MIAAQGLAALPQGDGAPPRQRSLTVGLALRIAVATALVNLAVMAAIYLQVRSDARMLVQSAIDADLAGLVEIEAARGRAGLGAAIADRLAFEPQTEARLYYRLEDGRHRRIAGNLAAWPPIRPELSPAGHMILPDGAGLQYRATLLAGGLRLVVGRSTEPTDRHLLRLAEGCAAALVVTVVLSFLIGRVAASALNRRITTINAVFEGLGPDGADSRAPVSPRADEIDVLSFHANRTLDRVERLLRARKELSDLVAHETRSPLMHVAARIGRARAEGVPSAADQALDAAQEQLRDLQRMLDALLDLAACEAQRGDLRGLPAVDLSALGSQLAELYEASAEAEGVELALAITPGVTMNGDPMQLTSLIGNLLDNAFKYGTAGGRIALQIAPGPRIVVEDCGNGIDPALQPRLFQRFGRSGGAAGGHGLGLALVRGIAERHGLSVRHEATRPSAGQPGARFVIE